MNYLPALSLPLQESLALQPSFDLQPSLDLQLAFDLQLALSPGALVLAEPLQPSLDLQPFLSAVGVLAVPSEALWANAGRAVMAPAIAAARRSLVVIFIFVSFYLVNQFRQRLPAGSTEPQFPKTFLCPQVSRRSRQIINKKMKLFFAALRSTIK